MYLLISTFNSFTFPNGYFLIKYIVSSILSVMAFAGKIICGVFEGKMMGQSLSTPDDAPVQTQQRGEEEPAVSYELERIDSLSSLCEGLIEKFQHIHIC